MLEKTIMYFRSILFVNYNVKNTGTNEQAKAK